MEDSLQILRDSIDFLLRNKLVVVAEASTINHTVVIVLIICAGLFGGFINYFRNSYRDKFELKIAIKPILIGLAASGLVPLFLNTISSQLLQQAHNNTENYYIFLGFCLIAAIFSTEFIDSIGAKVLNELKEVQDELQNSNTEDEVESDDTTTDSATPIQLNENQSKVLGAIAEASYTYRSITGIANQTGLEKAEVKKNLQELMNFETVEVKDRRKGPRWRMTSLGYKVYNSKKSD